MSSQWSGTTGIVRRYWQNYGGFKVIIASPYLHVSICLLILTFPFWFYNKWWEQSISIVPSILGFTIGGFAIFLGYGSDKFRSLLAPEDDKGKSPYLDIVTTFTHFIIIQTLTLVIALIASSLNSIAIMEITHANRYTCISIIWFVLGCLGYGIFLYSLILTFAVCFALYRLTCMYIKFETMEAKK
jgi:conserved hypothetical protein